MKNKGKEINRERWGQVYYCTNLNSPKNDTMIDLTPSCTKETFVVKKPIPATESKATSYFDQKGTGNQAETQKGIDELIDDGQLEHVGSD